MRPSLSRAFLTESRGKAERRLAATALAIRLYQHDHAGRLPPTLDALVPAYLPAVPLDPLAAGGQPVKYLPDAKLPYVYSVGENGSDETIGWKWRPDETVADVHRAPDLFFHLTPPPTKPEIDEPPADEK